MNFSFAFLQHEWTLVLHTVELETAVGMDSMTRWDCAIIGEFHTRRLSLNYSMIKYVWIFPSIVILEICQAQFIRWTLDKLWRITRRISFLFFCGFFSLSFFYATIIKRWFIPGTGCSVDCRIYFITAFSDMFFFLFVCVFFSLLK